MVISCAGPTPLNKSSRSYIYIQICLDQNGPQGDTRRQIEEVSILTLPPSLSSGCLPPSLLFSLPFQSFYFLPLCLCIPSFIFTFSENLFFIPLTLFSVLKKNNVSPFCHCSESDHRDKLQMLPGLYEAQVKGVTSVLCGFHFQNEPNYM